MNPFVCKASGHQRLFESNLVKKCSIYAAGFCCCVNSKTTPNAVLEC